MESTKLDRALGYTLRDSLVLEPSLDAEENIIKPDIAFETNELCGICKLISREVLHGLCEGDAYHPVPFYNSSDALKQSVLQGCHLCALFWSKLRNTLEKTTFNNLPLETNDTKPSAYVAIARSDHKALLEYRILEQALPLCNLELVTSKRRRFKTPKHHPERLSASNASSATFDVCASWIKGCISKHEKCRKTQTSVNQMPTRLLDTGENDLALRIIYPSEPVSYLTLSHCWGAKRVLKLNQDNHGRLTTGFDLRELPQLFRDTVRVTRRLGFRFIWIDSLCIIQDLKEDWEKEAGRMADVYRGGFCTIAGVSAPDSDASLFTKYHPLVDKSCYLTENSGSIEAGAIVEAVQISTKTDKPLHGRAWVMQERLLAPRTLEYTLEGIKWHCEEMMYADPYQGMNLNFIMIPGDFLPRSWNQMLAISVDGMTDEHRIDNEGNWNCILREYASSALSFETDRQYALKGILAALEQHVGLRFSAGVCENFLPFSLLWSTDRSGDWTEKMHTDVLATCPSWSAAFRTARTSPGNFTNNNLNRRCATVTFHTSDKQTLLRIKGPSYSIKLRQEDFFKRRNNTIGANMYPDIWMDFLPSREMQVDVVLLLRNQTAQSVFVSHGLILKRRDESNWERVGVFKFHDEKDRDIACRDEEHGYTIR